MEINKIYNESNIETMKRMPDGFVDLVVTSPPYDDMRDYNGYSFPFEEIAKELFRVTKQGGVVVWVVGDSVIGGSESGTSFKQALYFKEIGFNIHDTMIYEKSNPIPLTHNRYEQKFEYMFVFSKGKPKTFNPLKEKTNGGVAYYNAKVKEGAARRNGEQIKVSESRYRYNIWEYCVSSNDKTKHPAPFPETLAEDHIVSWSNEGDLVYDCFGGSGTVAKMAHKWKRNWILSEISSEYVQIAEKRIAPYLAQTSLF
jgi:site-specific DNA-methyltransferase (adenine-specific)